MKLSLLVIALAFGIISFSQRSEKEALKLITKIHKIAAIGNNKDFCNLVKEYTEDQASKETCGTYGYEKGDIYIEEVKNFIYNNPKEGSLSKPMKTSYGYCIIKVVGVKQDLVKFRWLLIKFEESKK